mgnify:CR=1 FL=1
MMRNGKSEMVCERKLVFLYKEKGAVYKHSAFALVF